VRVGDGFLTAGKAGGGSGERHMIGAMARVGAISLVMLGLGWLFLSGTNLSDRQVLTWSVATIALAWIADVTINLAVAPPPEFEEEDEDE
jgi:hypothetical protein